jgi:hypothetical protein
MRYFRVLYKLLQKDVKRHILPDRRWLERERGGRLCRTCDKRLLNLYPQPIDVYLAETPALLSVAFVSRACVGVISTGLSRQLPMRQDFVFGRCFDALGCVIPHLRSFYARTAILVRGGGGTRYYECRECGIKTSVWTHPGHVLEQEIDPRRGVYQDGLCNLYVRQEIKEHLEWADYPDVWSAPIEVRGGAADDARRPDDGG